MKEESAPQDHARVEEAMEAFCDYLRLLELGQPPEFDRFCAERPALEPQLRRLNAEYERVTAILDRLSPAASFSARLRARYGAAVDPGISLSGDGDSVGGTRVGSGSGRVAQRLSALRPSTQRYEPRGEIARGGMGAILRVWDRELRRMLAMKVVLAKRTRADEDSDEHVDERRLSRFLEEAQITAQLDHPGIVPVHDLGIDEKGRVYFTMQLIEGRDLREVFELARLSREGWTRARVLWAMLRVCEAMAYAHSKGVVHRDLKPGNIMVGRFGETYVMDWGLAKVVGREDPHDLRLSERPAAPGHIVTDRSEERAEDDSPLKTMDGDVVGTPAYMSPEQALGRLEDVRPQSDVYSVGAMLYHLLSGHMPYEPLGEKVPTTTILEAVRSGSPWPLHRMESGLDPELVAICEMAMARDAHVRYRDMMGFAEDLRAYLEGRVVSAYETGVLYEFRKWVRRNRGVAAALSALILMAVLSVSIFIRQQQVSLRRLTKANAETEAERLVTVKAKQKVDAYAAQLEVQRDRAKKATQDALERKAIAELNAEAATRHMERNLRLIYHAQVTAADYSLRLEDVPAAKASLRAANQEMRAWEWHHLGLAVEGSVAEVLALDRGAAGVDTSADGRRMLCMGLDLRARCIDLETGELVSSVATAPLGDWQEANPRRVRVALSPNGGIGMAASIGPGILVFNTVTGEPLGRGALYHDGPKTGLGFSRNGLRMFSASERGTVMLWENRRVRIDRLAELRGHEGAVLGADFDPPGARMITGGEDGTVRIWEASTGEELRILPGDRTREVTAVCWSSLGSADGTDEVAVAYEDGSLAIWDVRSERLETVMHGHDAPARELTFAPDGRTLFSASDDTTVRMWDAGTGRGLRILRGHDREVTGIALARGGTRLVSSSLDRTVRMWEPEWDPARTSIRFSGTVLGMAFDAVGERVELGARVGLPRRFDVTTAEQLPRYGVPPPTLGGPGAPEYRVMAASADGRLFALGAGDRRLWVLDRESGALLRELRAQRALVESLALSVDGELLACGASDGSVRVWRWRDPAAVALELKGHRRSVLDLAFDPRGDLLATVGRDRSLILWDVRTGKQEKVSAQAHDSPVHCVAFSPDGERLATGAFHGDARIWRRDLRAAELVLRGPQSQVVDLDFQPDLGLRLVTAHASGQLVLWDTASGDELIGLTGPEGRPVAVGFSPDGSRIASCALAGAEGESQLVVWESERSADRFDTRERAGDLRRRAEPVVERLYRELDWPELVLESLPRELEAGDPELLAAAERLARLHADDPRAMGAHLTRLLLRAEVATETCERAEREARRLALLCGPSLATRRVSAAASVRNGEFRRGLAELEALQDQRVAERRAEWDLAAVEEGLLRVLARLGVGERDGARGEFERLLPALEALPSAEVGELAPVLAAIENQLGEDEARGG